MSEQPNYKVNRLEEQIHWHSKKARQNKQKFRLCQIIILIAGEIIPIINVADIGDKTRIMSSIIGGIIVIITGLTQLEKYQENWILYRTSSELLKKEKYFFENRVGDYSNPDEKVESIVSAETSIYFTIHQPSKKNNEKMNQEK
jgi:hypothetical protein